MNLQTPAALSAKVDEEIQHIKRETEAAILDIRTTDSRFGELMRLKAPMDLWDNKSNSHRSLVKTYRRWMTGVTCLLLPLLAVVYWLGWIALDRYAADNPAGAVAMTLYVAGFIGAATAVALWFIRIIVRLYMSQHHMATDAEERAALIRTYLALSERGSVTDDERALVLSSVFRPTPDGIVKDDGAPQLSPAALLASMLDKK